MLFLLSANRVILVEKSRGFAADWINDLFSLSEYFMVDICDSRFSGTVFCCVNSINERNVGNLLSFNFF